MVCLENRGEPLVSYNNRCLLEGWSSLLDGWVRAQRSRGAIISDVLSSTPEPIKQMLSYVDF